MGDCPMSRFAAYVCVSVQSSDGGNLLMRSKSAILAIAAIALSAAALADTSGSVTLNPLTAVDLDSGATTSAAGGIPTGDILWVPPTLAPAALGVSGTILPQTGSAAFDALTAAQVAATNIPSSGGTFSASQIPTNTILVYKTKTGKFSKILITSVSSTSLGIKFVTFGGTGGTTGGSGPTISSVMNNYSAIAPGQPNYGIAPGSLFFVTGSGLATTTTALQDSRSPGLQTTLQGVTVTVVVGGSTLTCPLYYLSPTQIDAVLPDNTPSGTGTVTVALNGVNSNAFTITVVQSAFGIINYNGTLAATYDASNVIITNFNSANPGQTIVVWGSGVGGDPQNDGKIFPQKQDNLTSISMQVYIGGISATILYRGRSQFPGVDQIVVTIPGNVPTGCYVSLAVVSGSPAVVSNSATIPIAASGKTCSDSDTVLSPSVLQNLSGKSNVKSGALFLGQTTQIGGGTPTVTSSVGGIFTSVSNYSSSVGTNVVSIGSCIVHFATTGSASATTTPLDAGSGIVVSGPQGSVTMTQLSLAGTTLYTAFPIAANFIPSSGGTFTFDNGSGGMDVGHFNTSLPFPQNFQWTNQATVTTIDRTQGATVTWSGGAPGITVTIGGSSSTTDISTGKTVSGAFICTAPLSAGSFTVPTPVLLALPSGSGTLSLTDNGTQQLFTATGLDIGYAFATVGFTENVRYN
jgi:uncharacterized protein (TIGR03437 family)